MTQPALANAYGAIALLMWSSSALLVSYCREVPPFLLTATTLLGGFIIFMTVWLVRGDNIKDHFKFPMPLFLLAILGAGGYRILYFAAMYMVPTVEANLINYLWPVLIVFFSHFLPNEKLRWFHMAGALLGFLGIVVLLSPGMEFLAEFSLGHLIALLAALTWAGYSVISRVTKKHSSNIVPASFIFSALILFAISAATEEWEDALSLSIMPIIAMLSIASSVGYFFWDIGMKHGNIKLLGIASFFVPLISTFLLIAFGKAQPETHILLAATLIFFSAMIASKDKIYENIAAFRRRKF